MRVYGKNPGAYLDITKEASEMGGAEAFEKQLMDQGYENGLAGAMARGFIEGQNKAVEKHMQNASSAGIAVAVCRFGHMP